MKISNLLINFAMVFGEMAKPSIYGNCGGNYAGVMGTIASPSFPYANYPKNSNCKWMIEVPRNKVIEIDMAWMDLEPDPFGCKFDALLIQDYNSKSEKEKYCGTKPYFPIVSKTNVLVVEFVSDSNEEKSGFALRWKAIQPPKKIFDCDFDHGACEGWNLAGGDFPWQIGQGPETFEYKEKGLFVYVDSKEDDGDVARLVSPLVYPTSGESCLSVVYNMLGKGIGTLSVQTTDATFNQQTELFKPDASQSESDEWHQMNISISSINQPIHIVIVGSVGQMNQIAFGIDDIKLDFQPCPVEDSGKCAVDEYLCQSAKNCIPTNYICDGVKDCQDGDDEVNCEAESAPIEPAVPAGNESEIIFLEHCSTGYSCEGYNGCIPAAWLCDGNSECANGDDEMDCPMRKELFLKKYGNTETTTDMEPTTLPYTTTVTSTTVTFTTVTSTTSIIQSTIPVNFTKSITGSDSTNVDLNLLDMASPTGSTNEASVPSLDPNPTESVNNSTTFKDTRAPRYKDSNNTTITSELNETATNFEPEDTEKPEVELEVEPEGTTPESFEKSVTPPPAPAPLKNQTVEAIVRSRTTPSSYAVPTRLQWHVVVAGVLVLLM